jgi:hypothetical protein
MECSGGPTPRAVRRAVDDLIKLLAASRQITA